MARPEAAIVHAFLCAVGTIPGTLTYRIEPTRGPQHRLSAPIGHSDVVFVAYGRVYYLEGKSETGRQRPEQAAFQRATEQAGAVYLIMRDAEACCRDLAAIVGGDVGRLLVKAAESLAV